MVQQIDLCRFQAKQAFTLVTEPSLTTKSIYSNRTVTILKVYVVKNFIPLLSFHKTKPI